MISQSQGSVWGLAGEEKIQWARSKSKTHTSPRALGQKKATAHLVVRASASQVIKSPKIETDLRSPLLAGLLEPALQRALLKALGKKVCQQTIKFCF